ncbi:5-formyltetrahydrofolate cyclo-ligase [Bicyclus anynana]|uniref:5-formyltetrahydrofolate cyclo-ligase n=1 Tax=Bicyclus anynana TaxID=110368 RepID=A0A6J1MLV5_BICAN|nr:5-formyltetrahydrofolate cyclo-ligase [Bicyclus anynana]
MWLRNLIICYSTTIRMSRTPDPAKLLLREKVATRIAQLSTEEKKRQSEIVYDKIINHPYYKSAQRIAIFMNTDQEIDTMPIIAHIKGRSAVAFVPQYAGGVMKMLRLEQDDEKTMPLTRHGIQQHSKDQQREDALEKGLDLIIAPGVAFSRSGGRVGHGGGYYDKYITKLRATPKPPKIIAVAFDCQVMDEVPMNDQDQRIDGVIFADR